MNQRNQIIDIAKLLAIILVVYGHLLRSESGLLINCISLCHMPVFFAISGYFLQKEVIKYTRKQLVIKKCGACWCHMFCGLQFHLGLILY